MVSANHGSAISVMAEYLVLPTDESADCLHLQTSQMDVVIAIIQDLGTLTQLVAERAFVVRLIILIIFLILNLLKCIYLIFLCELNFVLFLDFSFLFLF